MTIFWIRFMEDGAISAFRKSVKYFKINVLKTSVKIDFGLKDPSSASEKWWAIKITRKKQVKRNCKIFC